MSHWKEAFCQNCVGWLGGWVALREATELVTKDKTGGGVQMQRNPGRTEDWGTWWGRLGWLSRGE